MNLADYELFRDQASSWQNMFPESSYIRRPPNLFNLVSEDPGLKSWFLRNVNIDHQLIPPQDIYTFRNVYVHDISQVFNENGSLINGTDRDGNSYESISDIWDRQICENIPGLSAFIFKSGKDNYGHLLIEMLPKLEMLDVAFNEPITLLVPTVGDALFGIIQTINKDIYNNKFILKRFLTPVVKCEELIYPGPITKHNNQKSHIVNALMEKLLFKYGQGLARSDLYISRRNFHNRRWVNEIETEQIFRDKGFTVIFPEKLNFQDQIATFASAKNIAGAMGAGLSNICFSPEDAKVIMIDNGMYDFFFYDLACLRRQEFSWIFTKKIAFENVTQLHDDWQADSSLIAAALSML